MSRYRLGRLRLPSQPGIAPVAQAQIPNVELALTAHSLGCAQRDIFDRFRTVQITIHTIHTIHTAQKGFAKSRFSRGALWNGSAIASTLAPGCGQSMIHPSVHKSRRSQTDETCSGPSLPKLQ
ncbi:hypothetical protein E4U41_006728 [Claviceps citrina]|nr:hypothetical protein E4U41_006728 [Claviceps citrina]